MSMQKIQQFPLKFGLFEKGTKFEKIFHLIFDITKQGCNQDLNQAKQEYEILIGHWNRC